MLAGKLYQSLLGPTLPVLNIRVGRDCDRNNLTHCSHYFKYRFLNHRQAITQELPADAGMSEAR